MIRNAFSVIAFLAAPVLAVSCSQPSERPAAAALKLEPYQCGKVQRIHVFGDIFLASQPSPEDFRHAKEGGIRTVVNLRKPDELDWDEAALVRELGMEYYNIPFKAPSELTDEVFDRVRALLKDPSKRPLLLHCSSANRVGAVWIPYRVLDGGLSFEEAEAEAKIIGLRLPAYAERAREYIARKRGEK